MKMRVRAVLMLFLLVIVVHAAPPPLLAVDSDVRVFEDDFSTFNPENWYNWTDVSIDPSGYAYTTAGRLYSTRWFGHGRLYVRMRITNASRGVGIALQRGSHDWYGPNIHISWYDVGRYKFYTQNSSMAETWVFWDNPPITTGWTDYNITWESNRVLFYVNGTLRAEITTCVFDLLARIVIHCSEDGGQRIDVDHVRYEEDYDASSFRKTPSLYKTDNLDGSWLYKAKGADGMQSQTWYSNNLTLWVDFDPVGTGDQSVSIHIPEAYRNYIVEIYKDGTKITSNVRFHRAERNLEFTASFSDLDPCVVEWRLVDPEPWMISLYYSLLPLGVDIGILLRWYDRLKARWRPLPWILLAVFFILLLVVLWLLFRLLGGMRV